MAYQKLQAERALKVIPSDTINIPNIAGAAIIGTTTQPAPSGTVLVDGTQNFNSTQGLIGSIVYLAGGVATVTSIVNNTTLGLSASIVNTGSTESYSLYADANQGCVLYVGNTGNVRVLTAGNDDVTFVGIPAGAFVPVQVKRVFATDTDATDIVALW